MASKLIQISILSRRGNKYTGKEQNQVAEAASVLIALGNADIFWNKGNTELQNCVAREFKKLFSSVFYLILISTFLKQFCFSSNP